MIETPAPEVLVVPEGIDPKTRLDRFTADHSERIPSRAYARKAIRRQEVLLNGIHQQSSRFLKPGDEITVLTAGRRPPRVFEIQLTVLYEDDWIAVINKPPGFETSGYKHRTVEHALPFNLKPSPLPDALPWPRCVHRLDYQTGGVLVCAKTGGAHLRMGHLFERREVQKHYRALVIGRLDGSGEVSEPVEGRDAHSSWTAIEHTRSLKPGWLTTVDLRPTTGRTHQLRRHLAHLGHPILGDAVYGTPGLIFKGSGLHLCAMRIAFRHPFTDEALVVERREPHKFVAHRDRETRRWLRVSQETQMRDDLRQRLIAFPPSDAREAGFKERMLELVESTGCASRDHFEPGHFTASSFLLSPDGGSVLLIFHGKLHRWLQPGGHVDPEDVDILAAARREVAEEVGVEEMELAAEGIFDVDIHDIPALKGDPAHQHFDVRFVFRAPTLEATAGSDAKDARWVPLDAISEVESDASVMRAIGKLATGAYTG